jgi:hypothetical protein
MWVPKCPIIFVPIFRRIFINFGKNYEIERYFRGHIQISHLKISLTKYRLKKFDRKIHVFCPMVKAFFVSYHGNAANKLLFVHLKIVQSSSFSYSWNMYLQNGTGCNVLYRGEGFSPPNTTLVYARLSFVYE